MTFTAALVTQIIGVTVQTCLLCFSIRNLYRATQTMNQAVAKYQEAERVYRLVQARLEKIEDIRADVVGHVEVMNATWRDPGSVQE